MFLLLLALYTACFTGLPDNPDAEVEFQTTSALARNHSFAIGGTPEADQIIRQQFNVVPGGPGREDRWYSWFGPGQALLGLPFYYVGQVVSLLQPGVEELHQTHLRYGTPRSEYFEHLVVGWRNPLLTALTAFLLVLTGRRVGMGRSTSWLCGLTYGLCTFAWAQARSTLSDVQATFFLFAAFHAMAYARERFLRLRAPRIAVLMWVGLALGMAFLTRVATAPVVGVLWLAAVMVIRGGHRTIRHFFGEWHLPLRKSAGVQVLGLTAPLLACVGFWAWLNYVRFGDPLESGYGAVLESGTFFSYPFGLGLAGLLVSPGKGLLWMAPGLVMLPWGIAHAARERERLWIWVFVFVSVATIVPIALTQTWHGAYTYGPRYLLPLLPFGWLGFGLAVEAVRKKRPVRHLATVACLLGLFVQIPASLVDHMTHQELASVAAREAWPEAVGADERERDDARFLNIQWDWGFAAPGAHWRILRHRLAGLEEEYEVQDLFLFPSTTILTPAETREQGFRHLAWVDFHQRLGGSVWPAIAFCLVLLWASILLSFWSLERTPS